MTPDEHLDLKAQALAREAFASLGGWPKNHTPSIDIIADAIQEGMGPLIKALQAVQASLENAGRSTIEQEVSDSLTVIDEALAALMEADQ